jgi:hypothetical protein
MLNGINMSSIAANVLDLHGKRSSTGEIIAILFEYCDLNCMFCSQDHTSILGMDKVADKFNSIIKVIEIQSRMGKTDFHLHIMGGEMFSDNLEDHLFDEYTSLINRVKDYCNSHNIPILISVASSFVWTKQERVLKFKNDTGVSLMASYDPAGRFNKNTFEIFKKNVQDFKDHINQIGVVITKPSIEKFMKGNVPFFDYLYNNFPVFLDYYGPQENAKFLTPKDVELRDFMKFMYDKWPNCYPIAEFPSKTKQTMSCQDTYTIMPDNSFGGCGKAEGVINIIPIKNITEQKWFDSYNCLECEHFSRCSLGCFMSNHVNDSRTQKEIK